ncbi:MAG: hypothetical protein K8F93_14090 [Burkholderiales bacterium]|nr:hypothetical protein [Burkholderiales bacterium]
MDRRTFIASVGTIGAATAGGFASLASDEGAVRAANLARAAGAGKSGAAGKPGTSGNGLVYEGLALGYLPGSPALLEMVARGQPLAADTRRLRWVRWDPAVALATSEPQASVSIGILQKAAGGPELLRSLAVTGYFAIDESPYVAQFPAWQYESAPAGAKRARATSPLTFEASMHDRVGLQVVYSLEGQALAPGMLPSGMLYLPLGARNGPGLGLYVLAGPSRTTGAQPDLAACTFSGDLHAPLASAQGGRPDFDYVTVMIRRSAA